jgi:hypothetical protein
MTIKSLNIILTLGVSSILLNASPIHNQLDRPTGNDSRSTGLIELKPPKISKPRPHFPRHWGHPPRIQVRDHVELPKNFGHGSSTLAKWISDNLTKDLEKERPQPKPPLKPEPRPKLPEGLQDKMDSYKKTQKIMQDGLKKKMEELGKRPSRESVRKTVEKYKEDNKDLIDSQKELGKSINEWHKDNKPVRPKRPEPTAEVKEKLASMKEKQKEMDQIRKEFQATLKSSKDLTKESRDELIKDFKEKNADKHLALKEAQKEVQKEMRELKQTGARRQ